MGIQGATGLSVGPLHGVDHLEWHHAAHLGQPQHQAQLARVYKMSCLITWISFYNEVTHLVDEGTAVDVCLNLSKAFGIVSHSNLLEKLAAQLLDK